MTATFGGTMNLLQKDKVHNNKNELFYHYPSKAFQHEYIAPANVVKGPKATFQTVMRMTLIIGQWFGLCPVLGVMNKDSSKLRFTFYSGRCLYTMLSIVGQSILVLLCLLKLIHETNVSLSSNTSLVFYGSNTLTTILFLRMAMKWPKLCQYIAKVEAMDPELDYSLIKKCNLASIIILTLAAMEHLLSDLSGIALAIDCQPNTGLYEAFILQSLPWIWTFLHYDHVSGFLFQFLNFQTTFNWNFADVFVICISLYLTAKFDKINQRLMSVRGKFVPSSYWQAMREYYTRTTNMFQRIENFVPSSFWRTMREDYTRTTNLVRRIDDVISGVIFISFANNLFFICLQLLHTLEEGVNITAACHRIPDERPFKGYEQAAYHVYSFVFLVARALAVSLVAARVHTASRAPAQVLYEVPSTGFCVEVQRFLDQIHGDTVALSGMRFFQVKRGLVLTIAGTIVTYELVLMQFAGVTSTVTAQTPPNSSMPTLRTSPK